MSSPTAPDRYISTTRHPVWESPDRAWSIYRSRYGVHVSIAPSPAAFAAEGLETSVIDAEHVDGFVAALYSAIAYGPTDLATRS